MHKPLKLEDISKSTQFSQNSPVGNLGTCVNVITLQCSPSVESIGTLGVPWLSIARVPVLYSLVRGHYHLFQSYSTSGTSLPQGWKLEG